MTINPVQQKLAELRSGGGASTTQDSQELNPVQLKLQEIRSKKSSMSPPLATAPIVAPTEDKPPEPGFFEKLGGGVLDIAKGIIKPVASTVVQFPRAIASGIAGLTGNEEAMAEYSKPINVPFLGEVKGLSAVPGDAEKYGTKTAGQMLGQAAEIGANLIGGEGAVGVAKGVGKQGILKAGLAGAKTGIKAGALGGFGSGMEDKLSAEGVVGSTIAGSALGGVLGGALGAGGTAIANKVAGREAGAITKGAVADTEKAFLEANVPDARVATKMLQGGQVVADRHAQELIKQGVSEPDVALIKSGSTLDKQKMLKMLDIRQSQLTNKRVLDRATDVVGNTFVEDIAKPIEKLNKEAAVKLDTVAKGLAGKKIDPAPAISQFGTDLENSGVSINSDGKLNYKDSSFEGLKPVQTLIDNVWTRAQRVAKSGDALQAHRLKAYIDEIVGYGKASEGLSGRAEGILKAVRHNIDTVLDSNFELYNKVNTQFSDTINELEKMATAIGKRFKPGTTFADTQAGVSMRRILSNTQSRADILRLLDSMQAVGKKYGIVHENDVITQANFADILEKMLGSEAPTSFLGQGERFINGIEQGAGALADLGQGHPVRAGLKASKYLLDMTRGVNQENKIEALRAILEREAGTATKGFGKAIGSTEQAMSNVTANLANDTADATGQFVPSVASAEQPIAPVVKKGFGKPVKVPKAPSLGEEAPKAIKIAPPKIS